MNSILQGTTPTLTINVNPNDLKLADIEELELTFKQNTNLVYKHKEDCVIDYEANTISYHFSEQETFELVPARALNWQLRFLMPDNNVIGTVINQIKVSDLISTEVMTE